MDTLVITLTVICTVAALSRAFGRGLAAGLIVWAGLIALLAWSGAFLAFDRLPPLISLAIVVPLAAALAATWSMPAAREVVKAAPLGLLIAVQANRLVIGLLFLDLFRRGMLPGRFALLAGWGDILVGGLALALGVAILRMPRALWTGTAALVWNVLGFCDLTAVVVIGQLSAPTPLRVFHDEVSSAAIATFPLALIPAWIVPIAFILHAILFHRLLRTGVRPAEGG